MKPKSNEKLCYCDHGFAYFTTQKLEDQWGDDWNDAPMIHNCGLPYTPCWHNEPKYLNGTGRGNRAEPGKLCVCVSCVRDWDKNGKPKYEVIKLAYDGAHVPPESEDYSVEYLNKGHKVWLESDYFVTDKLQLFAGASTKEFKAFIRKCGGKVYVEDK